MIILASKSPRRKELLSTIISDFQIIDPCINERNYSIEEISFHKALKVSLLYPKDLIISCDTIVILFDKVLNKPIDENEARSMLNLLSNNTHQVISTYTLLNKEKNICINRRVTSEVTFNKLSDELIANYIRSGLYIDKAGSYGIQDNNEYNLIKSYKGSLTNIIGLPIEELTIDLKKLNYL